MSEQQMPARIWVEREEVKEDCAEFIRADIAERMAEALEAILFEDSDNTGLSRSSQSTYDAGGGVREPLPCPFCGGADIVCCDQGDDDFAVTCKSCGASSKFDDERSKAVAAWNARPALPNPAAADSNASTDAITDDQITYANELAEDRRREWTANARLREALRPFTEYAPTSIMREDDSWVLRIPHNARQPMFADFDKARKALSPDDTSCTALCDCHVTMPLNSPSDRPADVTESELSDFLYKKDTDVVIRRSMAGSNARAILAAFIVVRR